MRRTTLTGVALALLLLFGGVAIAGTAPKAKPAGAKARTLHFDVRFSPFHLVDVGGDGQPSLGDYVVFHDLLLADGEEVGDEGGTCPLVDVEQGLIHCAGRSGWRAARSPSRGSPPAPPSWWRSPATPAVTRAWAGRPPWSRTPIRPAP